MAKADGGGETAAKRTLNWRASTAAEFLHPLGWRRSLASIAILFAFGMGFYLAQVYIEISQMVAERRAALTSAIYSAPLEVAPNDEAGPLHLVDRLEHLSYTRVENVAHPGEYSMVPGAMTVFVREFTIGSRGYPASALHLAFHR